jgi:hypothetical protein
MLKSTSGFEKAVAHAGREMGFGAARMSLGDPKTSRGLELAVLFDQLRQRRRAI